MEQAITWRLENKQQLKKMTCRQSKLVYALKDMLTKESVRLVMAVCVSAGNADSAETVSFCSPRTATATVVRNEWLLQKIIMWEAPDKWVLSNVLKRHEKKFFQRVVKITWRPFFRTSKTKTVDCAESLVWSVGKSFPTIYIVQKIVYVNCRIASPSKKRRMVMIAIFWNGMVVVSTGSNQEIGVATHTCTLPVWYQRFPAVIGLYNER